MNELLNQIAWIKRKTGFDEFGKPIFAFDEKISCRLEKQTKILKDESGQDIICNGTIFLKGDQEVAEKDIVTDEIDTYSVYAVNILTDEKGKVHHKEALLRFTDGDK